MVVCQYFLRGQCRFGDTCRNEHPANGAGSGQSTFGSSGGNSWLRTGTAGSTTKTELGFDAHSIATDFNPGGDKPLWPLSCYGPSKYEPVLITGFDQSAEELRVKAYAAIKAGNLNEYTTYETTQIAAANQIYANARANPAEAFEKARKQSKVVPYVEPTNATTSAFGTTTTSSAFPSTSSAFSGQPTTSAFGNLAGASTTSAFGTPAFGQPSFGQSSFGQTASTAPVSAFGQPAQTTSAFGQPSQPTTTSVFGQTSQPTSAFGQASQPTSVFGQSAFGQAAQNPLIKPASGAFSAFSGSGPSAFAAAASTPSTTANITTGGGGGAFSAFAGNQPSAFGLLANNNNTTSVFGQPSFGQPAPAANTNQGSVFGAPSVFGQQQQQQQPTSVFGANPTTSVFGGGAPATSVFGGGAAATPSVFGGGAPATSVFGGGAPTTSVFGGGATTSSPFGPRTQQPSTLEPPQPQVSATPSIAMSSSSSSGSGSKAKANVPLDLSTIGAKFPYQPGSTPYDSMLPENYMELVPQRAKDAFAAEKFEWGKGVPDWIPPLEVR